MKQSEFNYVVDLGENSHGVFNTYKNSLVVLTDEELDHLNNLENATEDEIKIFTELEFIVEDDRDERAGVKFKDADLIGFPFRITVGKTITDGLVEFKVRETEEITTVKPEDAIQKVINTLMYL